jgi:hypothetical protein
MRTGWNTAGTALDARTAAPVSPTLEQDRLAAVQVGGHDAQRQLHLLDAAPAGVVADEARQRLAADQAAPGKGPVGERVLVHLAGQHGQFGATLPAA